MIPVLLVLAVTGLIYLLRFQLEPLMHGDLMKAEQPTSNTIRQRSVAAAYEPVAGRGRGGVGAPVAGVRGLPGRGAATGPAGRTPDPGAAAVGRLGLISGYLVAGQGEVLIFISKEMKKMTSATLIGDVVRSRDSADRGRLHDVLAAALDELNAQEAPARPTTPLRITVGDEYQGVFESVGQAARAALSLRLRLLPEYDVRHGLGWGEVHLLEEAPRVEDGPGWWAARAAIDATHEAQTRPASRGRRTAFRVAPDRNGADSTSPDPAWVDGFLLLRDELVGGLSERSLTVLRALLAGRTQREIAAQLGVSASAVSQRVRADGLAAIVASQSLLEGAP